MDWVRLEPRRRFLANDAFSLLCRVPKNSRRGDRMKTFVLDTNVILHDPMSMFAFEASRVVVPTGGHRGARHLKRNNDEARPLRPLVAASSGNSARRDGSTTGSPSSTAQTQVGSKSPTACRAPSRPHQGQRDIELRSIPKKQGENVVFIS